MKRIPLYLATLLCGLFVVTSLSSCLDDDTEDTSIDATKQKQYQTALAMASGGHKAHFFYKNNRDYFEYDSITSKSVDIRYSTDSTLTIRNLPVSKLDSMVYVNALDTVSTYRKFYEALKTSKATPTISGNYCLWSTSYITNDYYIFNYGLQNCKFTLNYDGKDHDVLIKFDSGVITYARTTAKTDVYLYISDILLDYSESSQSGTSLATNNHLRGGGIAFLNY